MFKNKLKFLPILSIVLIGSVVLLGCGAGGGESAGVESVFENMEQALKNSNEELFKSQWHPQGYNNNLVGGSGMAGSELFEEGSGGGWYLKPDIQAATRRDGVYIIPSDIWSTEEDRAVDAVHAAVVQENDTWLMLGAGEDAEEIEALVGRYLAGESLSAAVDD